MQYKSSRTLRIGEIYLGLLDFFWQSYLPALPYVALAAAACEIGCRAHAAAASPVGGQLGAFSFYCAPRSGSKFQSESQLDLMSFEVRQIEWPGRRGGLAPHLKIPRRRHEGVSREPRIDGWPDVERVPCENIQR